MKTASCKAKGRRASVEAKAVIMDKAKALLRDDDVIVTSSSVTGEDLMLSPQARRIFPYCFELKNTEKLNVWAAIEQAQNHCGDRPFLPLVVFRRNNHPLRVVVDFEHFIDLVVTAYQSNWT